MDPLWAICERCGAGHGVEDFARQDPARNKPLKIQTLPKGREENHIETVWTGTCHHCGSDRFHIQLDPVEMVEFWEGEGAQLISLDPPADAARYLRTWRQRAEREQAEFRAWLLRRRDDLTQRGH